MSSAKWWFVSTIIVIFCTLVKSDKYESEEEAVKYLNELSKAKNEIYIKTTTAEWNYESDITDEHQKIMENVTKYALLRDEELWKETIKYKYTGFSDPLVRRRFQKCVKRGASALGPKAMRLREIITEMSTIYSTATVSIGNQKNLALDPDLTKMLSKQRDYNLLKEVWVKWRDASGKKVRHLYPEYVQLGNEMAQKNSVGDLKFNDLGDYWLVDYEDPDFRNKIEKLWHEVEPFYNELHAYVRQKLQEKYGDLMPSDGTIPAHLTGNMWSQNWDQIMDIVRPYPNASTLDVTDELKAQGYNSRRMYELAETFFTGIGWEKMTDEFWNHSVIEKPKNRKLVCHASAWDMGTKTDFRIKACTAVNMEDFLTVHHEMGHVAYYMLYKDQPIEFRNGANPGFHEAIGDVISLSVATPKHLHSIGLLKDDRSSEDITINYQMKMALAKITFIPYAYILDLWRWKVFSGEITPANYNSKWWEMRRKYQKISPPVERSEKDFDPGAKYHVVSDTPYVRYFVALIVQFQIHKALCEAANMPVLHECDIQNNKEAGTLLGNVLRQGNSVSPQEQLQQLTGSDMSAEPLLEYFKPLRQYIQSQIQSGKLVLPGARSTSSNCKASMFAIVSLIVLVTIQYLNVDI